MSDTCVIEWRGAEYELRYTFAIIRRMRAEDINYTQAFRAVLQDPQAVADYGDVIAATVAFLLRDAGCAGVTAEDVWRLSLSDNDVQAQCIGLFMWVGQQHFHVSENVPAKKTGSPKN